MNEKKQREITTRAFMASGHDGLKSLFSYIDLLERALLKLDRDIHDRTRSDNRAGVVQLARGIIHG